jgi:hypothetical protein
MKVIVSSGDRSVHVYVKGSKPKTLKKAKRTAEQLLSAGIVKKDEKLKLGFQARAEVGE